MAEDKSTPTDRKPPVPSQKPKAEIIMNEFLAENGISLALDYPAPERTPTGTLIINPPRIVAVFDQPKES